MSNPESLVPRTIEVQARSLEVGDHIVSTGIIQEINKQVDEGIIIYVKGTAQEPLTHQLKPFGLTGDYKINIYNRP